MQQTIISLSTQGRGSYDITSEIINIVQASNTKTGLCHIFVQHTSASIILCENADPTARSDLETFMLQLVPDGDPMFRHIDEGPDDMPAHVRSVLTQSELTIPIIGGQLGLGTWQGIYLWEHRTHAHSRRIIITLG